MSEKNPPAATATATATAAAAATPAPAAAAAAAPAPAAQDGTPKLTPAQLKAQKKAEKAARRTQVVAAKESTDAPGGPTSNSNDGSSKGGAKQGAKSKQDSRDQPPATPRGPRKQTPAVPAAAPVPAKLKGPTVPEPFVHLSLAKKLPLSKADKDVHPAVLAIGQQMANFTLKDNLLRLEATLVAFRKVIESYQSPPGHSFSRHFLPHVLNPQIDYLTECRPMSFSMGNAIRMVKAKIAKLDLDQSDDDSKKSLCSAIDLFVQERILYAEEAITTKAASMIQDSDCILTYGNQRLVRLALREALAMGRKFEVAVVDDPFEKSGQKLAKTLRNDGVRVYYYPSLAGIGFNVKRASRVLLGAEAMFANGSLYGIAGTADIAMAAKDAGIPVVALLETVNCDRDRVSVDSLTYNEVDPEHSTAESFRVLFDVTREKYIAAIVTESEEANASGSTAAILPVLRKLDERVLG